MFKPERIFSALNQETGSTEWFFQAREGNMGPYQTRKQAEFMLKKFTETCLELKQAGGRDEKSKDQSAALELKSYIDYELKNDVYWFG